MITELLGVLMMVSDTSAAATTQASTPAAAVEAQAPKEEKKICKREAATESRLGAKKVCLTAAQWRARDNGDATRGLGDVQK